MYAGTAVFTVSSSVTIVVVVPEADVVAATDIQSIPSPGVVVRVDTAAVAMRCLLLLQLKIVMLV